MEWILAVITSWFVINHTNFGESTETAQGDAELDVARNQEDE